ncbi:hypothetical protein MNV49_006346 [Pseudohyphozyma bogoriensis]|nr:hypothetical protein MNV49_006346 [Pseudohyphozyma bogoriensis]
MSPSLPPELLLSILETSVLTPRDLVRVSLASRDFRDLVLPKLYRSVVLTIEDRKDPKSLHVPPSSFHLLTLLTTRADLARLVHTLDLRVHTRTFHSAPSASAIVSSPFSALPNLSGIVLSGQGVQWILPSLSHHLSSFPITRLDWRDVTLAWPDDLFDFLTSLSTLTCLTLDSFPDQFDMIGVAKPTFHLVALHLPPDVPSIAFDHLVESSLSSLTTLSTYSTWTPTPNIHLLTSLRHFHATFLWSGNTIDWNDVLGTTQGQLPQSLECLEVTVERSTRIKGEGKAVVDSAFFTLLPASLRRLKFKDAELSLDAVETALSPSGKLSGLKWIEVEFSKGVLSEEGPALEEEIKAVASAKGVQIVYTWL